MPTSCLAGARVYAATAVGATTRSGASSAASCATSTRWSLVANVTLAIAITDDAPPSVTAEPGWRLATTVRGAPRRRNLLMAHYREDVLESLAAAPTITTS